MNSPVVSIGLPVHNGQDSVGKAVDSILAQDFTDFELIISDNASTDRTGEICRAYEKRDHRIRLLHNTTNIGVGPNHNRLVAMASGTYFSWAAHDVEYLPGMLRRCVQVIRSAPSAVVMVYPRCEIVDATGRPAGGKQLSIASDDPRPSRRLETVLRHVWLVNQLYGLVSREALQKTRLIDSFASSDYVLLAELAMLGHIIEIPEVLLRRRLDPTRGAAANKDSQAWAEWLDPRRARHHDRLSHGKRLVLEYIRSAWQLPLSPTDKLRCFVAGPYAHYRRILLRRAGRIRNRLGSWRAVPKRPAATTGSDTRTP